jgi:dephospho-CoA kinase
MQKIWGIAGEMGSGKGTLIKYAVKKYKARSFSFSKILRKLLKEVCLEESRKNLQKISTVLRKNFGEDLLAKTLYEKIKKDKSVLILVDSVRRLQDIKYLKGLKNFRLVYLEAGIQKRFTRITGRKENSDDKNKKFKEFKKEHLAETERQIKSLKKNADFLIKNNGTRKEFYAHIDGFFAKDKIALSEKNKH